MTSCHTLPEPMDKEPSKVLRSVAGGEISKTAKQMLSSSRGKGSAVVPLMSNEDALKSRLALIDSAERSVDIQLFIWMNDYTGRLIMERVLMAADRGVRVRLLLDDLILGISYTDREVAAVVSHPNVELRLYNPNKIRDRISARALDLLLRSEQSNQRMHNKTIIADGKLAIISGRNIGDHYFGYGDRYNLVDFGALLAGSVMTGISDGFDRYWNSAPTYNASSFVRAGRAMSLADFRSGERQKILSEEVAAGRRISLERQHWGSWFEYAVMRSYPARVAYVEDAPEVPCPDRPVIEEIIRQCQKSRRQITLVTPYLVPDERFMKMLREVRARGVEVVLLVPTVASNNHLIVHNQYQKYRSILLGMGVDIYEFKHRPGRSMVRYINEGDNFTHKVGLHAKIVVVDSKVTYLGSMNFDGRAMFVNTEEGVIVHSEPMAREMEEWIGLLKRPENSWKLFLGNDGKIVWLSGRKMRTNEPSLDYLQATLEFLIRPLSLRHKIFPDRRVYK